MLLTYLFCFEGMRKTNPLLPSYIKTVHVDLCSNFMSKKCNFVLGALFSGRLLCVFFLCEWALSRFQVAKES